MINESSILISIFNGSLLIFATPNESGTDGSAQPPFSTDGM